MRSLALALVLGSCVVSSASAGRNTNGALVVHTDDGIDYYSNSGGFCSTAIPATCKDLNPNGSRDETQVIWLLAAFPAGSSPRVARIRFGVRHAFAGEFLDYAPCGAGSTEDPEAGWPSGPGGVAGNDVTLADPADEPLFVFYWLAVNVSGSDPSSIFLETTFNPESGTAEFRDDSTPPSVDRIYDFGTMRWNGTGANACPIPLPTGVCCLPDRTCIITTQHDCDHSGGTFRVGETACDPSPCLSPIGACCFFDGTCQEMTREDCARYSCTTYQGDGAICEGVLCAARIGACCFTDGTCVMEVSSDCDNSGGRFACDSVCDPNPCVHWGACCREGLPCVVMPAPQCEADGGSYEGDGSDCESPAPCVMGACCLPNLACILRTPYGCATISGIYLGDSVDCPFDTCDPGACCFPDLTCRITNIQDCYWGTWYGSGTNCPPDPPCGETGAFAPCCFGGDRCALTTESDCEKVVGIWAEGMSDCAICEGPATRKTTWGEIKALFR
jgi:hypothetical protein